METQPTVEKGPEGDELGAEGGGIGVIHGELAPGIIGDGPERGCRNCPCCWLRAGATLLMVAPERPDRLKRR